MKVLIIEDENHSAERLQRYIRTLHPDYEISGITKSIVQSIDFLQREQPDLIFSDIRLQDGLSFDIFRQIKIVSPIIFATAYDQYAIQAFKFNSIDYLLKPIDSDELEAAIQKATERISRSSPVTTAPKLETAIGIPGWGCPYPSLRESFWCLSKENIHYRSPERLFHPLSTEHNPPLSDGWHFCYHSLHIGPTGKGNEPCFFLPCKPSAYDTSETY